MEKVGFGISSVEPSSPASTVLIMNEMLL